MDLPNLQTSTTETTESRSMYRMLAIVFVTFLVIGGIIGYITSLKLNKDEASSNKNSNIQTTAPVTYQGTVTYLGQDMYPNDQISYALTDSAGEDIILLKSTDDKLSIAQGLFVTVTGKRGKTLDGQYEVLQVTEVTLKNGSN